MTSRQYKWALLVLGIAGLVGGALGSWLLPGRATHVVTARHFRLVDGERRLRASLWLTEEGAAGLFVLDQAGKTRATLIVNEYGRPELVLLDEAEKPRAGVWLHADGEPGLVLADERGRLLFGAP